MSNSLFKTCALICAGALQFFIGNSYAEDWTYAAADKCKIASPTQGEITPTGSAQRVTSRLAFIDCPLVKEASSYAISRIEISVQKENTDPNKAINCLLYQSNKYDVDYQSIVNSFTKSQGQTTLTLIPPETLLNSKGYAGIHCVAWQDDLIWGVRYKQVN